MPRNPHRQGDLLPTVSTRPRRERRKQRYLLEQPIGTGGMGTIYRAFDRELDRTVAVKMLQPPIGVGIRGLLRLKREIILASRVSDDHVVRVHDLGELDGRAVIVMDWVDGENLSSLLQKVRTLPPS